MATGHNATTTDYREWHQFLRTVLDKDSNSPAGVPNATFTVSAPHGWSHVGGESVFLIEGDGFMRGAQLSQTRVTWTVRQDGQSLSCLVSTLMESGTVPPQFFSVSRHCKALGYLLDGETHSFSMNTTTTDGPTWEMTWAITLEQHEQVSFVQPEEHTEITNLNTVANNTLLHVDSTHGDVNATWLHVDSTHADVNSTRLHVDSTHADVNATLAHVDLLWSSVNDTSNRIGTAADACEEAGGGAGSLFGQLCDLDQDIDATKADVDGAWGSLNTTLTNEATILARIGTNTDAATDPHLATGTLFSKLRGLGVEIDDGFANGTGNGTGGRFHENSIFPETIQGLTEAQIFQAIFWMLLMILCLSQGWFLPAFATLMAFPGAFTDAYPLHFIGGLFYLVLFFWLEAIVRGILVRRRMKQETKSDVKT